MNTSTNIHGVKSVRVDSIAPDNNFCVSLEIEANDGSKATLNLFGSKQAMDDMWAGLADGETIIHPVARAAS